MAPRVVARHQQGRARTPSQNSRAGPQRRAQTDAGLSGRDRTDVAAAGRPLCPPSAGGRDAMPRLWRRAGRDPPAPGQPELRRHGQLSLCRSRGGFARTDFGASGTAFLVFALGPAAFARRRHLAAFLSGPVPAGSPAHREMRERGLAGRQGNGTGVPSRAAERRAAHRGRASDRRAVGGAEFRPLPAGRRSARASGRGDRRADAVLAC